MNNPSEYDNPFWEDVSDASYETLSKEAKIWISACSWSNQFAFPWEIGMYWDFHVGKPGHRAIGKYSKVLNTRPKTSFGH